MPAFPQERIRTTMRIIVPSTLPDPDLFDKNEDAYWAELRRQFLIPEDEIYLNNGTVGSSPAPVR